MQNNRRIILSLVALGRVTPAEAERLLILWNEGRDRFWILSVGIVVALLTLLDSQQGLSALLHITHALLPRLVVRHALAQQTIEGLGQGLGHLLGGIR